MAWCAGCVVIIERGEAANERGVKWHVHGGRDFTKRLKWLQENPDAVWRAITRE
jgi:hypothetical protein